MLLSSIRDSSEAKIDFDSHRLVTTALPHGFTNQKSPVENVQPRHAAEHNRRTVSTQSVGPAQDQIKNYR